VRLYEPPRLDALDGRTLTSVDPGARVLHFAEWRVVGGLWALQDVGASSGEVRGRPDVIVFEVPQDYADFQVARRDLDRLRTHVRRAARLHLGRPGCVVYEVLPRDWKRGIPKEVHHRRAAERLTPAEAGLLPGVDSPRYDHNAWDAVALGLWAVGRLARRRG
jgi:hypothetical protein